MTNLQKVEKFVYEHSNDVQACIGIGVLLIALPFIWFVVETKIGVLAGAFLYVSIVFLGNWFIGHCVRTHARYELQEIVGDIDETIESLEDLK